MKEKMELSILIPAYNHVCAELVRALYEQACAIPMLEWEIIVAEDGSTDLVSKDANRAAAALPHCRHIIRDYNAGRAAIRNFLVQKARGEWVLFIDSDMRMADEEFLHRYVEAAQEGTDAIYGGYVIHGDARSLRHNLRYQQEARARHNRSAKLRRKRPYHNIHTANLMARRKVMLEIPFNERIRKYGYEDVLWGQWLFRRNFSILHIDNPVVMEDFEDNATFVGKVEDSLGNLSQFASGLKEWSPLLHCVSRLKALHLLPLVRLAFFPVRRLLRRSLAGERASHFWLAVYKLGCYVGKYTK